MEEPQGNKVSTTVGFRQAILGEQPSGHAQQRALAGEQAPNGATSTSAGTSNVRQQSDTRLRTFLFLVPSSDVRLLKLLSSILLWWALFRIPHLPVSIDASEQFLHGECGSSCGADLPQLLQ